MENRARMEAMDKMLRELEDLKNSQTSVLKKIAQLEAENMNVNVALLNEELPEVHEHADTTVVTVTGLIEKLQTYRDEFVAKYNLDVVEETA
jgi:sulfur carrier protein ThiS